MTRLLPGGLRVRGGDAQHADRSRGSAKLATLAVLGALALLVGLGGAGFVAYDRGLLDDYLGEPEPSSPAELPPPPGVEVPLVAPPDDVLPPASGAAPTRLRRALADELDQEDFGQRLGVLVEDLTSGEELVRSGPDRFIPASTLKLLTAVSVLDALGPEHRFRTQVVEGRARGEIVLVGGGDPLLARTAPDADSATYPTPANLDRLARRTAKALAAEGRTRVRLRFDDSLFTGPAVSPEWEPSYLPDNVVTPISALWVDEGLGPGRSAPRSTEPAVDAAEAFAAALGDQGIRIRGGVRRTEASDAAAKIAEVPSPTLDQIVGNTLLVSDNEGAEVLLRHVGLASGRAGSFAGGVAAMTERLTALGVDMTGARLHDGSGLARGNRLHLDTLLDTLRVAADPARKDLRSVVTRLPIAGFTGSLSYRFTADLRPQTAPGRGVVRAKTGTLTGVHGVAGVILDRDGAVLLYAAIADRVRVQDTLDARAELDDLSAAIAACGCS